MSWLERHDRRPFEQEALAAAGSVQTGAPPTARSPPPPPPPPRADPAVEEKQLDDLPYPNLRMVQGVATGIDTESKALLLAGPCDSVPYGKLCVCAGARPRRLAESPHVLTVRDTHSVAALRARLATARRVVVVGNGGIALELM